MNSLTSLPVCVVSVLSLASAVAACSSDNSGDLDITDARNYPTMLTTDVSTYVTDSGYTRYHIIAPLWVMYEEADTPHWTFPDGLYMEKYDNDLNPEATFRADSATYLSVLKVWRFDGKVNMRNVDGDRFATPQLFWDQNARRVYSDSFMHIERTQRIIEGYGFESNENMTQYTVLHPQMILPIDRMRQERADRQRADSVAATGDSVAVNTSPKPATMKPAAAPAPTSKPEPKAAEPRRRHVDDGRDVMDANEARQLRNRRLHNNNQEPTMMPVRDAGTQR